MAMDSYVASLLAAIGTMDVLVDWPRAAAMVTTFADDTLMTDAYVNAEAAAFNAEVDYEIETNVLPRFQRGMQDINSVMSSSFVVGEALIESAGLMKKTTHLAQFRQQLAKDRLAFVVGGIDSALKIYLMKFDLLRMSYQLGIEGMRIGIVAEKEQVDSDIKIEELDAKWDFEVLTYGGNILASLHGATSRGAEVKSNTASSAIGGAMSGGAGGAAIASMAGLSGPWGWAALGIGAALGGVAGLLS
jgi:hypothetical protein